jgi:hypothetical protein
VENLAYKTKSAEEMRRLRSWLESMGCEALYHDDPDDRSQPMLYVLSWAEAKYFSYQQDVFFERDAKAAKYMIDSVGLFKLKVLKLAKRFGK